MIEIYSVKGVLYGRVVSWESHQQIRAKRSKYPSIDEADSIGNHVISDDSICHRNPIQSNPIQKESKSEYGDKSQTKKFIPPTVEEVREYCRERQNSVDADKWHSYYTANGWKVGKNQMKDWKGAVRTWEKPKDETGPTEAQKQVAAEKRKQSEAEAEAIIEKERQQMRETEGPKNLKYDFLKKVPEG